MATWDELSIDSRSAAQVLLAQGHTRSSISRAYFAAYAAATARIATTVSLPPGRLNPSHADLARYVGNSLGGFPVWQRQWLGTLIRRLWKMRVDAEYVPGACVDHPLARQALRDVHVVLRELGVSG